MKTAHVSERGSVALFMATLDIPIRFPLPSFSPQDWCYHFNPHKLDPESWQQVAGRGVGVMWESCLGDFVGKV